MQSSLTCHSVIRGYFCNQTKPVKGNRINFCYEFHQEVLYVFQQ